MRLNFSKRLFAKIAYKTNPCNEKNDLMTVFFDIVQKNNHKPMLSQTCIKKMSKNTAKKSIIGMVSATN